ncbi:hypothetical protein DPMN_058593 [Dreissena polymorpha]|uniref:Uncharacterized protein n=1 Tax=Dreissena polymorpha TaxID=45954 RepID=A0A9D4HFM5_DREPO|nr:hypothetical protein DPMN_058593 [Dreissena polymorpha]
MISHTPRQDLCPIWKEKNEISKNNWGAIQWKGVKGINEASVKRNFRQATTNWQGMMRMLHQEGQYPEQSSVKLLPIMIKLETATEKKKHELAQTKPIIMHQDFTELAFPTSPQYKDSSEVHIKRDASDLNKMQTKITTCSPYTADHR